jgi:hypothetical protein
MNEDGTLLQFQHMGLGWISFLIPPNERSSLLGILLSQALFQPPAKIADMPAPTASSGGGTLH